MDLAFFCVPLSKQYGWTISQVTFTFTISIFVLGFAAFFGGLWMNRKGPRIVALTAAVLYGLGVFLRSVVQAIRLDHFPSHIHVHDKYFRTWFCGVLRRAVDESQRPANCRAHRRRSLWTWRFSGELLGE